MNVPLMWVVQKVKKASGSNRSIEVHISSRCEIIVQVMSDTVRLTNLIRNFHRSTVRRLYLFLNAHALSHHINLSNKFSLFSDVLG